MRYVSTRGGVAAAGFTEMLMRGLAPDGGLYLPESWPLFSPEEIAAFSTMPFAEVAARILGRFVGDEVDHDNLSEIAGEAYAGFTHASVAPLRQLYPNIWLAELWHGPALVAADIPMQILARLIDQAAAARGKPATVLLPASTPAAIAAAEAFRDRPDVRLLAIAPQGRTSGSWNSALSAGGGPARIVRVPGGLDDCQALARRLIQDEALRSQTGLTLLGGASWAYLAASLAWRFTAAAQLGAPHREVAFAAPAGDLSEGFAALAARNMGLPVRRVLLGTDANDAGIRVFREARFARTPLRPGDLSDLAVAVPENFERLYFEANNREALETRRALAAFAELGVIDIPPKANTLLAGLFAGATIAPSEVARTLVMIRNETGVMVGPLTALMVAAARRQASETGGAPIIIPAMAHPAYADDAVSAATGEPPPTPPKPIPSGPPLESLPADPGALAAYLRAFVAAA